MANAMAPRLHRTIWYMGAKARVIPGFLQRVLQEELEEGDTVLDLMSGTGVVSSFCADRYRVVANDAQGYSTIIARSLIEHDPATRDAFLTSLDPHRDLVDRYRENLAELEERYRPALAEETRHLDAFAEIDGRRSCAAALRRWADGYRAFLRQPGSVYPASGRGRGLYRGARSLLTEAAVARHRRDPFRLPAGLVTAYYQGVYYGLRQAVRIDSLRVAIEALDDGERFAAARRTHYLSALIHAASVSTSGTSHFAQPRHLTKDSELAAMARRRQLDPWELFLDYNDEIACTVAGTEVRAGNRAHEGSYLDLLDARGRFAVEGGVDLVYLDPPYTADHYSRFYHVLEVLARYDWPELETGRDGEIVRGRYPQLRHRFQSGFCRGTSVEDEFRRVVRASAASGAKLVISYASPTGLLLKTFARQHPGGDPLRRLRALVAEGYGRVRILKRPLTHSGQGDTNLRVEELLVVGTRPRTGA